MSTTGQQAHDVSGIRYTGGRSHGSDRIVLVISRWNSEITDALCQGALQVLKSAGVRPENILCYYVPGSFELPAGAQAAFAKHYNLDGVICLGCVIQGETPHFTFISQAVAQGIMTVGLEQKKPVIFGVLTTLTQEQAQDRAGGKYGNKGEEAAVALLDMIDLERE